MLIASVFISALLALTMVLPIHANNIQVGTPTLTGQNTTDNYTYVQFDLSWDNSWRTSSAPNNWDAAWVFVKYKKTGGDWVHATLNTSGHSVTTENGVAATITTPSDGKGAFLYRTNNGTGSINWDGVKLRWNYGADGLQDSDTVTVKVFAIEMVYVPQGTLNLNTTASPNMYNEFTSDGITQITSEDALAEDAIKWSYYNPYGGQGWSDALGASYPKGYAAFYCMKYEISQGQYADFLNTITSTQASNRYPNMNGNSRHTISGSHPNFSASRPDRACNYLSWADGCAYADWAGLRPMTELEFEKACRGDQSVVTDEFAWGNTTITAATTISGTEDGTETITNSGANCCYNGISFTGGDGGYGPLRCGIFAKAGTTRQEAGASYYGIMELSGNLWERYVTVADQDHNGITTNAGLFNGSHGDGTLDGSGNADASTWPGTDAVGAGFRGGFWSYGASYLRVSDRNDAGVTNAGRFSAYGSRVVRSSP
jgi:formylglycine-generating enzyme required for sulfatase activity